MQRPKRVGRRAPKPFAVEIRRSGRGKAPGPEPAIVTAAAPPAPPPVLDEQPTSAIKVVPTGRILPALDAPAPPPRVPDPEPVEVDELDGEKSEALAIDAADPLPPVDVGAIAATLMLRQGRSRLPRDAFRREERWRARLPAAVHRTRRRGA